MAIRPDSKALVFGPWELQDAVVGPARVPYLDEDGDPADFTGVTISNARLTDPAGLSAAAGAAVDPGAADTIAYTLPGTAFLLPGIWTLGAQLAAGGNLFRTVPASFVVEDAADGWADVAGAREGWRDAPGNDVTLWRLLNVARVQVIAWAETIGELDPAAVTGWRPPQHYVTAQLTQTRNIWNAVKTDPASQGIGDAGFIIRPFPMDWTVKNMIRPPSAKPSLA